MPPMEYTGSNEKARLAALKDYEVLDTLPEDELDALAKLASEICGTPIALISLIDEDRQWFKANIGLNASETPRNISFCQHAIRGEGVYEIKNASEDPLFTDNPLVTGDPNIKFYAGAPLTDPNGYNIGTLCVIDTKPRALTDEQKTSLKTLSKYIINQFELHKAKKQLEESRRYYHNMVERATDILYTTNIKGEFTFVSKAVEKFTGYKSEELIGKHFTDLVAEERRKEVQLFYLRQFKNNIGETRQEFEMVTAGGEKKWVEQTVVLLNNNGEKEGFQGIVRDIDSRKKAELALADANRATEEIRKTFQSVLDNTDSVIAIKDLSYRYILVNKKFEKLYGISNAEVQLKTDYDIRPKAVADELRLTDEEVTDKKRLIAFEQMLQTKNGQFTFFVTKFPLYNDAGQMYAFCMMATDITERKKTEVMLREKDEKFSQIFHSSPVAMTLGKMNPNRFIEVNAGFSRLFGYRAEEVIGMNFAEAGMVDAAEREKILGVLQQKGYLYNEEIVINDKDGNKKNVLLSTEIIIIGGEKHSLGVYYDITERKKLEMAVQERDMRFSAMFNSSPVAMTLGSISPYRYLEANPAFSRLTGYTREETIHLDFARDGLVSGAGRTALLSVFARQGYLHNHEVKIQIKGGESRYILLSTELVTLGGERMALSVYHDITERKQLEEQLTIAKEQAEESGRAKEQFLANMSHEIRTPMNAVLGFTDLLSETKLNKEQSDYVKSIETSGRNLMAVINDILDYSKIEAGMLTIEEVPLSIRSIFSSLFVSFNQQARKKKLKLTFEPDKKIPEVLGGDPGRLTQIITNLTGNAIKFTDKGSIKVKAKLIFKNKETTLVRFTVEDTGIGIPKDKLDSVFERFNQGSNDTTRKYGGTGLGLSIVKKLAELQGGVISVKSKPGKGSVFTVEIPYKTKVAEQAADEKARNLRKIKKGSVSVLLVEDNRLNQKLADKILTGFGFKTEIASNGKIAVDKLKKKKYNLVLMDMQMPVMNGYEATQVIRNKLKNSTPIIAMTAHAMASEREKCLQLGMNDYISKPFKKEDLYNKIVNLLDQKPAAQKPAKKETKSKKPAVPKTLDLTYLLELAEGSREFVKEVLEIFVKEVPEDLQALKEAIELAEYRQIKDISHKLKSSIILTGLDRLRPYLQEMEQLALQAADLTEIKKRFAHVSAVFFAGVEEAKNMI